MSATLQNKTSSQGNEYIPGGQTDTSNTINNEFTSVILRDSDLPLSKFITVSTSGTTGNSYALRLPPDTPLNLPSTTLHTLAYHRPTNNLQWYPLYEMPELIIQTSVSRYAVQSPGTDGTLILPSTPLFNGADTSGVMYLDKDGRISIGNGRSLVLFSSDNAGPANGRYTVSTPYSIVDQEVRLPDVTSVSTTANQLLGIKKTGTVSEIVADPVLDQLTLTSASAVRATVLPSPTATLHTTYTLPVVPASESCYVQLQPDGTFTVTQPDRVILTKSGHEFTVKTPTSIPQPIALTLPIPQNTPAAYLSCSSDGTIQMESPYEVRLFNSTSPLTQMLVKSPDNALVDHTLTLPMPQNTPKALVSCDATGTMRMESPYEVTIFNANDTTCTIRSNQTVNSTISLPSIPTGAAVYTKLSNTGDVLLMPPNRLEVIDNNGAVTSLAAHPSSTGVDITLFRDIPSANRYVTLGSAGIMSTDVQQQPQAVYLTSANTTHKFRIIAHDTGALQAERFNSGNNTWETVNGFGGSSLSTPPVQATFTNSPTTITMALSGSQPDTLEISALNGGSSVTPVFSFTDGDPSTAAGISSSNAVQWTSASGAMQYRLVLADDGAVHAQYAFAFAPTVWYGATLQVGGGILNASGGVYMTLSPGVMLNIIGDDSGTFEFWKVTTSPAGRSRLQVALV